MQIDDFQCRGDDIGTPVSVPDEPSEPFVFNVLGANPTHSGVTMEVMLSVPARLTADIYGVDGRRVWAQAAILDAGPHRFSWDGRDSRGQPMSPGVYFIRVESPTGSVTRKLTLLR